LFVFIGSKNILSNTVLLFIDLTKNERKDYRKEIFIFWKNRKEKLKVFLIEFIDSLKWIIENNFSK
jgi:hypothetical protein